MQLCDFAVGEDSPLFFIAGPCVIESEDLILNTASKLKAVSDELGVPIIFKSSFDKANRSSIDSYRGPGIEEGLRILQRVKDDWHAGTDRCARGHAARRSGQYG